MTELLLVKVTKANGEKFFKKCTEHVAEEISESYGWKTEVVGIPDRWPRLEETVK